MSVVVARLGENDVVALFKQPDKKTGLKKFLRVLLCQKMGITVQDRNASTFKMIGEILVEMEKDKMIEQVCDVLLVSKRPWDATLQVDSVAKDTDNNDWSLKINYTYHVTNQHLFYENLAGGLVYDGMPLSNRIIGEHLNMRIQKIVKEDIRGIILDGQTLEEIKHKDIVSIMEWKVKFSNEFNGVGLIMKSDGITEWYSPDAKAKEEILKREEAERRLLEAQKVLFEKELERKGIISKFRIESDEIENKENLSKDEIRHQSEIKRKNFHIEMTKKEVEIVEAQIALKKKQIELECIMVRTEEEIKETKIAEQRFESEQGKIKQKIKDDTIVRRALVEIKRDVIDDILSNDKIRQIHVRQKLKQEYKYPQSLVEKILCCVPQVYEKTVPLESIPKEDEKDVRTGLPFVSDHYKVLEFLGEGATGKVFKAYDRKLQRTVAIKVLNDKLSNNELAIKRFEQEAFSSAKLKHPNIVTIYDIEICSEKKYISMEYIDGKTLKSILSERQKLDNERREPLSEEESLNIARQICEALVCAHENGVIHRDIKPSNIMINKESKVIVTDFGIARVISRTKTITKTGEIIGTPYYMSPGQAKGEKEIDARADIYSLGIVLYEMLTGKVPFDADSDLAICIKHMNEEPVPPRKINPQLSKSLENIILKCLKKSPDERYQSVEDLLKVLKGPGNGNGPEGPDMALIKEDWYEVGTPPEDRQALDEEKPRHKVHLSSFYIDKKNVSVNYYKNFVNRGGYSKEKFRKYWTHGGWKWKEENDIKYPLNWKRQLRSPHLPVTGVSWYEARAYALWRGKRLPTEHEWEVAAEILKDYYKDFLGVVWQWCEDWYDHDYYSFIENNEREKYKPQGPEKSKENKKVCRGVSSGEIMKQIPVTRGNASPDARVDDIGFRCVLDKRRKVNNG